MDIHLPFHLSLTAPYSKCWFKPVCVCVFLSMIKLVLVLRVPYGLGTRVNVPLTCGEAYENQPVFWQKNGNTTVTTTSTTNMIGTILINLKKQITFSFQKTKLFLSQMAILLDVLKHWHRCYINSYPCLRRGCWASSAGEPGQCSGGGDGWRKLHLSPRPRRRIPQPHRDPNPTRPRQQDCHTGRKIPCGW